MFRVVLLKLEFSILIWVNWTQRLPVAILLDILTSLKHIDFTVQNQFTKFVETRHAVFLESEMMKGEITPREIDLEEKRDYVPMPIIQEPYFAPTVGIAPSNERVVETTPVETPVIVSQATPNDLPSEDVQHPQTVIDVSNENTLRRSQ